MGWDRAGQLGSKLGHSWNRLIQRGGEDYDKDNDIVKNRVKYSCRIMLVSRWVRIRSVD